MHSNATSRRRRQCWFSRTQAIDGTGAPPKEDLCVVIESGRTTRVEDVSVKHAHPSNAKILDLSGKTVILGLVGMHEHLY
jgi:imidazolonepropionase-like amidohydrolase